MSETLIQELLQQCSTCRSTKLLETYFSKNVKGQYMKTCDKCRVRMKENKAKKLQAKKYYQENRKIINEKNKIYQEKNKEKLAEYNKKYAIENKEKLAGQSKIYRENNKDKIAEYYDKNKEKLDEKRKIYYADKRHHCDHNVSKQQCKICCPNGHLKHTISRRVGMALKANKSKKSLEYLGCDIPTFKEHIEKSFKENMSWENYGFGDDKWNIDHIIPILYKQDNIEPSIEEVGKRLHYLNTQAMWQPENFSKGNSFIG